jgi:hypothetical protein
MTESHHQICAEMHVNGFSGPCCLTFAVRRPGASEQSENERICVPTQISFLMVDLEITGKERR